MQKIVTSISVFLFNFRVINPRVIYLQNLSLLRTQLRTTFFRCFAYLSARKVSTILYKSKIFVIVRTKKIGTRLENWSNQRVNTNSYTIHLFHIIHKRYSLFKNSSRHNYRTDSIYKLRQHFLQHV